MAGCERAHIFCIKLDGSESVPFIMKKDRLLVGRGDSCEIRVHVDGVASEHCAITVDYEGKAYLEPLDASGLTFLNNSVIVQKMLLEHNDMFKVVTRSFRFAYPRTSTYFKSVTGMIMNTGNKFGRLALLQRQFMPNAARLSLYKKCQRGLRSSRKSQASSRKNNSCVDFRRHVKKEELEDTATKKKVTFGPHLSPEEFDKDLPPSSPLRKGSLPPVSPIRQNLLKCRSDFQTQKLHGIMKTCNKYSISSPKTKLEFTLSPVASEPILKESEINYDLSSHLLCENKQYQKIPLFSEVLKKPITNDNCVVKKSDKKVHCGKKFPRNRKMVPRAQALQEKVRMETVQNVLGVGSTGHANSPATIFICKKRFGSFNKKESPEKIQRANLTGDSPNEFECDQNKRSEEKSEILNADEVISSPEVYLFDQPSKRSHVTSKCQVKTKNRNISKLKMKPPMKKIAVDCLLESKKSCDFEEKNICLRACGSVNEINKPRIDCENNSKCDESMPSILVKSDANNFSTPICLPERRNSLQGKLLIEEINKEKDIQAKNSKTVIVTADHCNKLSNSKSLQVVDKAVQSCLVCPKFGCSYLMDDSCSSTENFLRKLVFRLSMLNAFDDLYKKINHATEYFLEIIRNPSTQSSEQIGKRQPWKEFLEQMEGFERRKFIEQTRQLCHLRFAFHALSSSLRDISDPGQAPCKEESSCVMKYNQIHSQEQVPLNSPACGERMICAATIKLQQANLIDSVCGNTVCSKVSNVSKTDSETSESSRNTNKVKLQDRLQNYKCLLESSQFSSGVRGSISEEHTFESGVSNESIDNRDIFKESPLEEYSNEEHMFSVLDSLITNGKVYCEAEMQTECGQIMDTLVDCEAFGQSQNQGKCSKRCHKCCEEKLSGSCDKLMEAFKNISESEKDMKEKESANSWQQSFLVRKYDSYRTRLQKSKEHDKSSDERNSVSSVKAIEYSASGNAAFKLETIGALKRKKQVVRKVSDFKPKKRGKNASINSIKRKHAESVITQKLGQVEGVCKVGNTPKELLCSEDPEISGTDLPLKKSTRKRRGIAKAPKVTSRNKRKNALNIEANLINDNIKCVEEVETTNLLEVHESPAASRMDSTQIILPSQKRARKHRDVAEVPKVKGRNKKKNALKIEANVIDSNIKCVKEVETTNLLKVHESPAASGMDPNQFILPSLKRARKHIDVAEVPKAKTGNKKKNALKMEENKVDNIIKCVGKLEAKNLLEVHGSTEAAGMDVNQIILSSKKRTRKCRNIAEVNKAKSRNKKKNALKIEENIVHNIKCIEEIETSNLLKVTGSTVVSGMDLNQIILPSEKRTRKRGDIAEVPKAKTRNKNKNALKIEENLVDNIKSVGDIEAMNLLKFHERPEASVIDLDPIILPSKKRKRNDVAKCPKPKKRNKKKNVIKIEENLIEGVGVFETNNLFDIHESCAQNSKEVEPRSLPGGQIKKKLKAHHYPSISVITRSMVK